ncbi:TM2 domain-containing protein [Cylindrospermum sp. NIES-4074]|nr:TM2 domain-containing protein [Cylindrospermum sp. NIES-4074]
MNTDNNKSPERVPVSYILWATWFLGFAGLHRIYNGKIGTGLVWFFTFGLFGIGQLVDLFYIPNIVEEYDRQSLKAGLSPLGVPLNQAVTTSQVYRPTSDQLMIQLLEAAESNGGFLTVTKGVKATGASFAEVEAVLKEMCKSGYVKMDNDTVTGAVTYHFHEL